ncbi:MAG: hypothetical protein JWP97_6012 [Labilithrix sp.]|nr:hypothetical protein [Labilithrix sp.]
MQRALSSSLGLLLAATLVLTAAPARADTPTPTKQGSPVAWLWPKFEPAEIAFTGGMGLSAAMAVFLYPPPKNNWDGALLLDKPLRDLLVLPTRDARIAAGTTSDFIYYALAAYPLLDTLITAGLVHRSSEVTLQMVAIDLESYALGGAIAMSAERAGRRRPMARECARDPGYDKKCDDQDNLNSSFLSGHTTIGFVGAGLLCAHHLNVPLYGGGAPDTATCIAGMSAAIIGGVLRGMSDNHWASDVVLGAGTGVFAGYVVPTLLHYGRATGRRHALLPSFSLPRVGVMGVVAPTFGPQEAGAALTGAF